MSVVDALELLGSYADGHGPEADAAYDTVCDRISVLEKALEYIAESACCGCYVHERIAKAALDGPKSEPEGPPEPVVVVARGAAGVVRS